MKIIAAMTDKLKIVILPFLCAALTIRAHHSNLKCVCVCVRRLQHNHNPLDQEDDGYRIQTPQVFRKVYRCHYFQQTTQHMRRPTAYDELSKVKKISEPLMGLSKRQNIDGFWTRLKREHQIIRMIWSLQPFLSFHWAEATSNDVTYIWKDERLKPF